ncbi:GldG family protein [Polyangium jinanense]|uniref:GldG family protein n=1 Tax=Polyangium jinanense TaxID=2829994 RepID=A0A9X3X7A1_9BACT|nr:GldG family protein [Polyangium jinanense]MDC3958133.1 GldG family protein [Polyangium jinanense]MDC3983668.1 GldG family protein [Polyangium jinanense]
MERKTKARAATGVYLVLVAAILVVVNVIAFIQNKRVDVTKNERFTLSKGSARLVSEGLKQDLQVDVYVTRGGPKQEAFIQDLVDLMNEYERGSNGKFKYTLIEPKTEEQRTAAKEAGLQEAAFGEGSETGQDQATITRGFMGIAFKYGSEKEAIPILSADQSQGLEFWITNKIRELRDRADNVYQKYGVITGKDEIKLTDTNLVAAQPGRGGGPSMKGILDQALPFYKIEEVDLQNGDAEINKELAGIIITQPAKDYTEKELRRIDQFLMEGNKSVVVIAGAVNLKASDAAMKAELNLHGLDKLLDGYGVEMKKEAIMDWGRPVRIAVPTQTGQVIGIIGYGMAHAQHVDGLSEAEQTLDSSFAGFFRIEELAFPFPSTLVPHPEKQPGAQMKVVARSTPRTTIDTSDAIDLKFSAQAKPKGEYGQRAMAVALEGKIKSAFGGAGEGIETPAESKDKSRLLVISASQFLANPYARSGNAPPMPPQMMMMGGMGGDEDLQMLSMPYAQNYLTATILAFKNVLDWMSGDSDLIATSAKLLQEPKLTYANIEAPKIDATDDEATATKKAEDYRLERKKTQTRVQWSLTLFGPLLFAAFGLFRWWRRENARGSIRLD